MNQLCAKLLKATDPCLIGGDIIVFGLESIKRPLLALLEEQSNPAPEPSAPRFRHAFVLAFETFESTLVAVQLAVAPPPCSCVPTTLHLPDAPLLRQLVEERNKVAADFLARLHALSEGHGALLQRAAEAMRARAENWDQSVAAVVKLYN